MAIKASDNFKVYHNEGGPDISTLKRPVIEQDGLYFKDIDGSGTVSPVNDWRLSPEERAAAGLNNSIVHVDFMVGTRDLSIIGTTHDGEEIPVFVDGNFAF